MDVEMTLHELRELAADVLVSTEPSRELACALAQKFEDLDGWLSRGGHVPAAWRGAEQEDHR